MGPHCACDVPVVSSYLGDLLAMVIKHLLNWMILQGDDLTFWNVFIPPQIPKLIHLNTVDCLEILEH